MTAEELRKAEARYQRAFQRAEVLRKQRNALVVKALADGCTHAEVSQAIGLSRARVGQIKETP